MPRALHTTGKSQILLPDWWEMHCKQTTVPLCLPMSMMLYGLFLNLRAAAVGILSTEHYFVPNSAIRLADQQQRPSDPRFVLSYAAGACLWCFSRQGSDGIRLAVWNASRSGDNCLCPKNYQSVINAFVFFSQATQIFGSPTRLNQCCRVDQRLSLPQKHVVETQQRHGTTGFRTL